MAPAPGGTVDIVVPDIGDFDEVAVIEVLVKPGDTVSAEQSLITVESDKASMEIPSSHAGVVKAVKVKLGDKVAKGTPIVSVETTGDTPAAQAAESARALPPSQRPRPRRLRAKPPAAAAMSACRPPRRCRRTNRSPPRARTAARLALDPQDGA